IRPLDSLPRALRAQLPFPVRAFRAATALVERWRTETAAWSAQPREPFEIVAPSADGATDAPRVWMGQSFEAGTTFAVLVAATMALHGPRVSVWRPSPAPRLPPVLVGSPNTTAPGVPRLWNVAGACFFEQALFSQPASGGPPTGIDTVFLSWGEHRGQGRSVAAALRSLLASGGEARMPADTALAARWRRAQQLAAQADAALAAGDQVEPLPLGVLVAATAGWMGYMIQQSLQNAFARAGVTRQVVTLITQTLCDPHDPNLRIPTKPIGHALDPVRVARLQARGVPVTEEQQGRWRRLAPSPRPTAVVEREMIHHLIAAGHIVVACGCGGPPVYDDPTLRLEGQDAVADKDRVAAILGREIDADVLLILTNVDAVYHAYGTPQQTAIRRLSLAQADHLLAGKELGLGSMRPKVEAAADFVRTGGAGRGEEQRAIIAELAQGLAALQGDAGTTLTRD